MFIRINPLYLLLSLNRYIWSTGGLKWSFQEISVQIWLQLAWHGGHASGGVAGLVLHRFFGRCSSKFSAQEYYVALKIILYHFEDASGLSINFYESSIYFIRRRGDDSQDCCNGLTVLRFQLLSSTLAYLLVGQNPQNLIGCCWFIGLNKDWLLERAIACRLTIDFSWSIQLWHPCCFIAGHSSNFFCGLLKWLIGVGELFYG